MMRYIFLRIKSVTQQSSRRLRIQAKHEAQIYPGKVGRTTRENHLFSLRVQVYLHVVAFSMTLDDFIMPENK